MKQKKISERGNYPLCGCSGIDLVDSADLDGWNRFFCPFFPYDSFAHYALYFG